MIKVYLKLIGFGVALTGLISLFSALGIILNLNDPGVLTLQILAFFLAAIFIGGYMLKKDKTLVKFGFQRGNYSFTMILFMATITIIQPLIMGHNKSLSAFTICLIIIQMLLVGFVEESLFRSIFFFFLGDNPKNYLYFSSSVFGLLHVASGINPDFPAILVFLQVINALLLGLVFGRLYLKTKSIYPTILFHALFNIFASISADNDFSKMIVSVCILLVIYLVFILYLGKKEKTA